MSPSIERFRREADPAAVVAAIRRDGVAIIERLFPADVVDLLAARLTSELERREPGGGAFFGNRKRSLSAIFGRGREFAEQLLENERILELADGILLPECPMAASAPPKPKLERTEAEALEAFFRAPDPAVGPNCHHYRINATVAMQVCRGGGNQMLHRDEWRYLPYMHVDRAGPELTLAVMVACTDFTAENGATRLVPGSHRWPVGRMPEEGEVTQAVMPKGSAAFWLGGIFHGLGASRVDEPRTGIIYSFVVDRLTQEENQFLAVPPAVASTLPYRSQQLLGYRSGKGTNWVEGLDQDNMLKSGKSGPL